MDEGDLGLLVCPLPGCSLPLPDHVLQSLFDHAPAPSPGDGDGAAVLARLRRLRAEALVSPSSGVKWCPAAGCGRSVELPAAAKGLAVGVTCACGHGFCFGCGAGPAHEPASCAEWEAFGRLLSERRARGEQDSEGWIRANTTRCRRCEAPIQVPPASRRGIHLPPARC
jgi:ariadne-1